MPMYDYKCSNCGHTESRIVSIKDRNRQKCEEMTGEGEYPAEVSQCGGKMVREEVAETAKMGVQWAAWQGANLS